MQIFLGFFVILKFIIIILDLDIFLFFAFVFYFYLVHIFEFFVVIFLLKNLLNDYVFSILKIFLELLISIYKILLRWVLYTFKNFISICFEINEFIQVLSTILPVINSRWISTKIWKCV